MYANAPLRHHGVSLFGPMCAHAPAPIYLIKNLSTIFLIKTIHLDFPHTSINVLSERGRAMPVLCKWWWLFLGSPENEARGISMLNINSIPLFVWLTRAAERFDWRAYFDRRNCRTSVKMNAKNGMECECLVTSLINFLLARLILTCRLSLFLLPLSDDAARLYATTTTHCT